MKVHQLIKVPKKAPGKRVGRGYSSGKGSTAGRGHKGELSRAGHKIPAGYEGGQTKLVRRLPKRRGFNNKWKKIFLPVPVAKLNVFKEGAKIALKDLIEKGICEAKARNVKIVGDGELTKRLTVVNLPVTKSVREKIEKLGGEVL
jgi:large subunit ribosomal protein L15